ncbi:MIP/aquaporin family protein [Eupransor demetentiae]|uniref:Glycerol uptake facilitator or related aquaporin (Major Intrinsic protein Family) (GlpF) n=1 Tax=Eupransor demetentiae TaxID=3109584 RepID=A0ABM9N6N7_9LACO|nr:Glycerol uptake facilitator or related aquaporin (Major Intrinsic protein Family) (GlpF) [Lactobacillaceae bacterium LMG 33000]
MRKYLAEFMGTCMFVLFTSVGLVYLTAFNFSQIFDIMMVFGLALMAVMFIWGPFANGGYFNPATSLGAAIEGEITWKTFGGYLLAQIIGGIAGIGLTIIGINGVVNAQKTSGQGISTNQILAAMQPASTSSLAPYSFGIELVMTFFLVLVILLVLQTKPKSSPFIAGVFLLLATFVTFPLTGGALNPVRVISPAVFSGLSGSSHLWLYLLAQFIGGALAGVVMRYFFMSRAEEVIVEIEE